MSRLFLAGGSPPMLAAMGASRAQGQGISATELCSEATQMPDTISVIVPVYKVEQYLRECVDSILSQTYGNLEIILVDDGSPDGCPAICDDYARKDPRVRVIHKPNGGLSSARNAGLQRASGSYIAFVDSDDVLAPHHYELLAAVCGDGIVVCSGVRMFFQGGEQERVIRPEQLVRLTPCEAAGLLLSDLAVPLVSVWNKLFPAALAPRLRFPEGFRYEDQAVLPHWLPAAREVVFLSEATYGYRRGTSESITALHQGCRTCDHLALARLAQIEVFRREGCSPELVESLRGELAVLAADALLFGHWNDPDHCNRLSSALRRAGGLRWLLRGGLNKVGGRGQPLVLALALNPRLATLLRRALGNGQRRREA